MSEANKSLLTRANAAVAAGDYEGFLAHCTDDTEWVFVGDRTLSGKAAVGAYMRATYVEPPRFTADRLVAGGDAVVAVGHIHRKDESGRLRHYEYCDVWRVRDGKLAGLRAYVVEIGADA